MMRILISLVGVAVLICGCGTKGPPEISLEQVPEALKAAFASARQAVRTSAEGAAKLVADRQYVPASLQLQALASNPDLSDEQRSVLAGATVAVNRKLQELAESGESQANQADGESKITAPAQSAPAPSKEEAAAAAAALEYHIRTK